MNQWISAEIPWLVRLVPVGIVLILLRRSMCRLWRLGLRSAGGLAALALLHPAGQLVGITLGVNWVNALLLGVLGLPGFGLLLMLQWMLQTP